MTTTDYGDTFTQTDGTPVSLAGNVDGAYNANVVKKIYNAVVPSSTTAALNDLLRIVSTSPVTLEYASPAEAIPPQTMLGDVTGTTAASSVVKIGGVSIPIETGIEGVVGDVLTRNGAGSAVWQAPYSGGTGNIVTTGYLALGSNPADSGSLRLSQGAGAGINFEGNYGTDREAVEFVSNEFKFGAATTTTLLRGTQVSTEYGAIQSGLGVNTSDSVNYAWPAATLNSLFVDVSGLTAARTQLVDASAERGWQVTNNSAYALTLKRADGGGTGVVIQPNETAFVRTNVALDDLVRPLALGALGFLASNSVDFEEGASSPVVRHVARTGDQATGQFYITAQSAYASATGTNANGGALLLQGGARSGTGNKGGVKIQINAGTSECMLEATHLANARRVLSLVYGPQLSTTQVPTNGGDLVIFIGNCATAPTAAPVGGGVLYVEAGALKYIGTGGTITPIAAA